MLTLGDRVVGVPVLDATGQAGFLQIAVTVAMASKTKPSESDPVWQIWKDAIQFDVDDLAQLVSPNGIKDTAEHTGICPIEGLFHSNRRWPPLADIEQDRLYRRLEDSYL